MTFVWIALIVLGASIGAGWVLIKLADSLGKPPGK